MKKKNIIIGIALVLILILVLLYYFIVGRTYNLDLPKSAEVTGISFDKSNDGVFITARADMDKILDTLYDVKRETKTKSVQDSPVNVKELIQVDFYLNGGKISSIYVYKKGNKYYIEQPYNGIYKISKEEYNDISKYMD